MYKLINVSELLQISWGYKMKFLKALYFETYELSTTFKLKINFLIRHLGYLMSNLNAKHNTIKPEKRNEPF